MENIKSNTVIIIIFVISNILCYRNNCSILIKISPHLDLLMTEAKLIFYFSYISFSFT